MSLRYERTITIELPIYDREKMRNFFIEMQKQDFFLGEYKNTGIPDYYVPTVKEIESSTYVFTDANGNEMFKSDLEYHSRNISRQLTINGFEHTRTQVDSVEHKESENEIPSLASLYLTDDVNAENWSVHTIEGKDMTLDVSFTTYSWEEKCSIRYQVVWTTDEKRAPKEIENKMNDYFISEMSHIQQVFIDNLLKYDIVLNEPVLNCKFECVNHTSQACSKEIADATLHRITEAME